MNSDCGEMTVDFRLGRLKEFQLKIISAKRLKRNRKGSFALSRVQRRAVLLSSLEFWVFVCQGQYIMFEFRSLYQELPKDFDPSHPPPLHTLFSSSAVCDVCMRVALPFSLVRPATVASQSALSFPAVTKTYVDSRFVRYCAMQTCRQTDVSENSTAYIFRVKTWTEGTTKLVQVFLNCLTLRMKTLRLFETLVNNLHGVAFQNISVLNSAALRAFCLPQHQRQYGGGDGGKKC